uniref:Endonuclease/exonuclease/phosphatase domain-containing protein n=1 Tax=Neogobius melanostomus TaxID=47308 RepID=A0A8C6SA92_9GOBI
MENKVKRYKVLSHLRSLSCDVAMLQEVHVKETEVMKLRQRWVGQVFSSPGNGAAKGVSILISKRMSFRILEQIIDPDGRYLIISGYLQNQKCTLVNIYAPNTGQIDFLSSLTRPLPSDRALSAAFTEFKNTLALTDVWRTLNPMTREYRFYSKVHNSYSRIDFLLLPKELLENVIDSQIHNIIISDHAPVFPTVLLNII